jgi:hypothetical protein
VNELTLRTPPESRLPPFSQMRAPSGVSPFPYKWTCGPHEPASRPKLKPRQVKNVIFSDSDLGRPAHVMDQLCGAANERRGAGDTQRRLHDA